MNRRDFFINTLKAAGAAATLSLLDQEHLLAIPPSDAIIPAATWQWDGSATAFLARLNEQFDRAMGKGGHVLRHSPYLGKHSYGEAICQLGAGWRLPTDFRLGMATLYERASPQAQLVYRGEALCSNRFDPVGSVDTLAEHFAAEVIELDANFYATMELPRGVHTAIAQGPFRFVSAYDIMTDRMIARVDMLVARTVNA